MTSLDYQDNDEISLKDLVLKIQYWVIFLKNKISKILLIGILGGIFGFFYAWYQPVTYTAKTTFVLEDAKSNGGLGGLASLAGQFGVDMGGSAGGGLISGDNILLYFKSESLIRHVLLSSWNGKISYADRFLEIYQNKKMNTSIIPINILNYNYSRKQDSIINSIVQSLKIKNISINKVDKKAGFIELSVLMIDEEFAKKFNDQIVDEAINQYIKLKTDRHKRTVEKLQLRADSLAYLLNLKINTSASLQTKNIINDVNPIYKTSFSVKNELIQRDKVMLSSIYVEVVKNLELAKFTLSNETPVIQIVNPPIYPLQVNKISKSKAVILSGILFSFLSVIYIIGIQVLKRILN